MNQHSLQYDLIKKNKQHSFNIIVLLLLAIAIFSSQSGFIIWQSLRSTCYHYLRARHSEPTTTLYINKADVAQNVVWIKKDEVQYQGRMFDIKYKTETKTLLILTGHFDTEEDELFEWLKQLVENKPVKHKAKHKISFWIFDATISLLYQDDIFVRSSLAKKQYPATASAYPSCILDAIHPPPEHL